MAFVNWYLVEKAGVGQERQEARAEPGSLGAAFGLGRRASADVPLGEGARGERV